jgi:pimeloyl-ACP methyl ester carboxylesterase
MIVFAHGLEGSPQGRKSTYMRGLGLPFSCLDLRGQPLLARLARVEEQTRPGGILLVGSSYGGLVAALLAQRHPERFVGLVLCAPALGLREPPNLEPDALMAPVGVPTMIIHGLQDSVTPIEHSRAYRDRSRTNVTLHEVCDDHPLRGSLDLLGTVVLGLARDSSVSRSGR